MVQQRDLVGAVLTGGASRRMGRTKALVEVDGVAMATRVANALRAVGCVEVVAVGGDPLVLAPLRLDIVADLVAGEGPLSGVIAALERFVDREADVFVVACDLPYLDATDLRAMVAGRGSGIDVVVARTLHREPTCAIWSASGLPHLRRMFAGGERALHRVIDGLEYAEVDVVAHSLANINTPDDLDRYP